MTDDLVTGLAGMGPDPGALAAAVRRAFTQRFGAGCVTEESVARLASHLAIRGYRLEVPVGVNRLPATVHDYDWAPGRRPALLCLYGTANCGLAFVELAARVCAPAG